MDPLLSVDAFDGDRPVVFDAVLLFAPAFDLEVVLLDFVFAFAIIVFFDENVEKVVKSLCHVPSLLLDLDAVF